MLPTRNRGADEDTGDATDDDVDAKRGLEQRDDVLPTRNRGECTRGDASDDDAVSSTLSEPRELTRLTSRLRTFTSQRVFSTVDDDVVAG